MPAAAAAATAAIAFVRGDAGGQRCKQLWENVASVLESRVFDARSRWAGQRRRPAGAIFPIVIGDESKAIAGAESVRERGLFIPAIRYPTVGRGQARLRLTLSAAHNAEDIRRLLAALDATVN